MVGESFMARTLRAFEGGWMSNRRPNQRAPWVWAFFHQSGEADGDNTVIFAC